MSSTQLVYVDTNVFSTYLLPYPNPKSKQLLVQQATKQFFLDIENGKYLGIISTLTEIEYRGIAKKLISQRKNRSVSSLEEQSAMRDFNLFVEKLGIGLINSDRIALDNASGKYNIFESTEQVVKASNPIHVNYESKLWKMIRSIDALMLNMAVRARATLFATLDTGFRGINNTFITPLIIPDVYKVESS